MNTHNRNTTKDKAAHPYDGLRLSIIDDAPAERIMVSVKPL